MIGAALKLAAQPILIPSTPDPWQEFVGNQDAFLRKLTERLAKNDITVSEWHFAMNDFLRQGHIDAHKVGQLFAGLDNPITGFADHRGRAVADAQSYYLTGFYNDLRAGKFGAPGADDFREDAAYYRSRMYLGAMRGTAGMGFVDVSPFSATFTWHLGAKDHCSDCPELAAGSPYTKDTLYTTPGAGDTPCLGYCDCELERDDGARSPGPIAYAD